MPAITPEQTAQFRTAFNAVDVDGSGAIDARELSKVMTMLGEDSDEASVRELLEEMDTDTDGSISFTEFTAMMMGRMGLDAANMSEAEMRRRASTVFVEADRTPTKRGWMEKRATTVRVLEEEKDVGGEREKLQRETKTVAMNGGNEGIWATVLARRLSSR